MDCCLKRVLFFVVAGPSFLTCEPREAENRSFRLQPVLMNVMSGSRECVSWLFAGMSIKRVSRDRLQ